MRFLLLLLVAGVPMTAGGCAATSHPREWRQFEDGAFAFRAPPHVRKVENGDVVGVRIESVDHFRRHYVGSGMEFYFDYAPDSCKTGGEQRSWYRIEPFSVSNLRALLAVKRDALVKRDVAQGRVFCREVLLVVTIPVAIPDGRSHCLSATGLSDTKRDQATTIKVLRTVVLRGADR